ncbi:putative membrane protein [Thermobacillus composti KWC4]|uniref:Putative membrane protein n=1 Tax=Thermobacillus composti (strain DSM 18247 / JCM 13945 / KWC4) TaxID=717605 RepID=L0EIC1_THECK|nr:DoxX family protein [Thermobacillus composti]AGA59436.1 putative membrane protein [Thermobacillus composti KWC4]
MAPLIMLVGSLLLFRLTGYVGWAYFDDWTTSLRFAVALMFLLTASAHWGKRRPDLIRMVPPAFPKPELLVTLTGWLEIIGAVGIVIPAVSPYAAVGLVLLLAAMFPANVHAARRRLTLAGKPATPLLPRTLLQLVFLAAVLLAGFMK